jgi:tetratricopeptide (TPR) repeat protein
MQKQVRKTECSTLRSNRRLASYLIIAPLLMSFSSPLAFADAISPNITSGGKVYSEEKPNREFFGSGMSGRLSEASHLRFSGEQAYDDGDYAVALKKLSKAIQLDPGDPTGHFMYARAMTAKINRDLKKGVPLDEEMLTDCIDEWKLIARHDADISEQAEAKAQGRRLARIAKTLNMPEEEKVSRFALFKRIGRSKVAIKEKPKLAQKDFSDFKEKENPGRPLKEVDTAIKDYQ